VFSFKIPVGMMKMKIWMEDMKNKGHKTGDRIRRLWVCFLVT
jgi:hypothetical protein